jgi:hypothetical protein
VAVSGNNRVLVVIAAYYGSGNFTTVTYGGVGMTQQSLTGDGQPQLGIWTLVAPSVGTADVQVNATSGAHIRAVAIVLNDVNQSTPFGTVATGTSTSDNPSVVVDTAPGDYAIGAFVINSDTAGTPSARGSGQSILDGPTVGINGSVASTETDSIDPATGNSAAFTWTCPTSALWLAVGIAVKPI